MYVMLLYYKKYLNELFFLNIVLLVFGLSVEFDFLGMWGICWLEI